MSFDVLAATASLRDFQRATVDHVAERLFAPGGSRRFLVADETGLGKSLVARGLVAKTIDRFDDDPNINRIDIVYICSSIELARQNLSRLDCAGLLDEGHRVSTDRLSLLALAGDDFNQMREGLDVSKPVNLVAFTPGTSFDHGNPWGQARERALIVRILEELLDPSDAERRRLRVAFRGNAKKGFGYYLDSVARQADQVGLNTEIVERFTEDLVRRGLLSRVRALLDDIGPKRSLPDALVAEARDLCSTLRASLARASVDTLEPDLVILDEFQKFRKLLDRESGEAAELANDLFEHSDAHVLLLSATPYKPFTLAVESDGPDGDDHARDLEKTLEFLSGGDDETVGEITSALSEFRRQVTAGVQPTELAKTIGERLRALMVRTERPPAVTDSMVNHVDHGEAATGADDLVEFAKLRNLADLVGAALPVDYWKSVPHFANHLDGYKVGSKVNEALDDPNLSRQVAERLRELPAINRRAPHGRTTSEHPRYATLRRDLIDSGMWKLPWLPPSVPYTQPGGAWADPTLAGVTKRVIFSNWSATPAAIATLLSHDAKWEMTGGADVRRRLNYTFSDGRPTQMSTLALFWPHPRLAAIGDLVEVRRSVGALPDRAAASEHVADRIAQSLAADSARLGSEPSGRRQPWEDYFASADALPSFLRQERPNVALAAYSILGETNASTWASVERAGVSEHIDRALSEVSDHRGGDVSNLDELAEFACFGPGNVAWRALGSVIRPGDDVTDDQRWIAAAVISDGLRSLFNRPDLTLLIDQNTGGAGDDSYWRHVLGMCADGNLQAVLEEYLHHLRGPMDAEFTQPDNARGDSDSIVEHRLIQIAHRVRQALAFKEATLRIFDPSEPDTTIPMPVRFAVRYGGKNSSEDTDSTRPSEVREAFNSPFWPYVLASTSVGQEGIDFHWWCHAIVHWNLPASPVDFEQREGRVHRFAGHAVRRNVADLHGERALSDEFGGRPVWDTLWELAQDRRGQHGDLSPEWVYTGSHHVQRHVFPFALSKDPAQLKRLEKLRAQYRLAFGQPRQEDMLRLLGDNIDAVSAEALRIDLRPDGTRVAQPTRQEKTAND